MKFLDKKWFLGWEEISPYLVIVYLIILGTFGGLIAHVENWDTITSVLVTITALYYAFFYMLPGLFISGIVSIATVKAGNVAWRKWLVIGCTVGTMFLTQLALWSDLGLFHLFGFHFNALVWNLLTTPGGFASMGLRSGTILTLSAGIGLLLLVNIGIMVALVYFPKLRIISTVLKSWCKYVLLGIGIICLIASLFISAYSSYMQLPTPQNAIHTIPLYCGASMSHFFANAGLKAPDHDEMRLKMASSQNRNLNYPLVPITRNESRPRYNVVWLACESFRADMLDPEIMPNASKVAEKCVNFKTHYSGGNGTRQGVFTMFYSLYGSYWKYFLENRRGPLFLDWLLEDGYNFKCITSAKFSYPEFDQTVFSSLPKSSLYSDDKGLTYARDQRNVKKLVDFIRTTDENTPFMAFMFFESPHAPYEFPEECIIRSDYAKDLNYAKVSKSDRFKIKNRYINACHHLDARLAEVFSVLDEKNLWDRTILVLVGDHGEEFYEKGRLGHNSVFHQEQIRTPLLLHIPGVEPRIYTDLSSHLDIVPMIAPYLGVEGQISNYSLGLNLLDPAQKRNYVILADWSSVAYASTKYKATLISRDAFATQKLTDGNDAPLPSPNPFYRENQEDIFQIQLNLHRFLK